MGIRGKPKSGSSAGGGTKPRRRLLRWVLGGMFLLVLGGMGVFIALYYTVDIPDPNAAATAQANIYQTADGKVLARIGQVNRQEVPLSQVPLDVQHAFVAAENKTFYTDSGVDLRGMARGVYNTLSGKGAQGGSTITQQYVKNFYLDQNQTVTRKAKELIIALKVDQEVSKDDILDGYLNTCYFGRGAYGIEAAAQAYYGVDASKLTIPQGAYLAALVQAPSEYDMATADAEGKRLALARWNYVLDNMTGMHWLDPAVRGKAAFPQPVKPKGAPGLSGQTGYFVDLADRELVDSGAVTEQQLLAGGWTITLTIDPARQRDLENAVKAELTSQLHPATHKADNNVQAGAASVDPKTGDVVALYGGVDYTKHYVSNATRADYQVASTFKPIEFASALQNGSTTQAGQLINASSIYDGTSGRTVQGTTQPFAPSNEDHVNYGRITVQKAMNDSVNSVFAQLAVDVGLDKVADTAVTLGMPSDTAGLRDGPSIALGSMGASPLTMAGIYATFDNHGQKITPTIVKSAEHGGQRLQLKSPVGTEAINRSTADDVTSVLTGVVNSGTGTAARQTSEVAGKTGTSDSNKSAWFTGYTPDLVTSVGLFGSDPANSHQVSLAGVGGLPRVNGGGFPAQIWGAYTRAALSGESPQKFDLETDQGAAATPTSTPSATPTTSASPTVTPSAPPTATPSGPAGSPPPTGTPTGQPSLPPTPTGPSGVPGGTQQPQLKSRGANR